MLGKGLGKVEQGTKRHDNSAGRNGEGLGVGKESVGCGGMPTYRS